MTNAPKFTKPTWRRWTTTASSLSAVAIITACSSSGMTSSSSSGSSGPATSGSADPCAQVTALRSTLTDLSHASVSITGAGRIASDLSTAEQQLNALKSQGGPFAAQATQLSNELNAIKTNAAALAKSPTPTNLSNLTNSISSFKSTSAPLIKEMQTACP